MDILTMICLIYRSPYESNVYHVKIMNIDSMFMTFRSPQESKIYHLEVSYSYLLKNLIIHGYIIVDLSANKLLFVLTFCIVPILI